MKRFDRYFIWFGRIVTLPLAGYCFYVVWDEYHKVNGDAVAFTAFIASGVFCIVYFAILLQTKTRGNDDNIRQ